MPAPRDDESSARPPGRIASFTATVTSPAGRRAIRAAGLAVPVLLVNAVAFTGQFGFLRQHLPWALAGIVMAALALESIAIYLQWHAHLAQLANDSALRLRLASYALAAVIGALNYSHYALPGWKPTAAAVICGLMSVISPWLWAIHSKRVSRDALMALGQVEGHSVRLGGARWFWHPYRSLIVMNFATWVGENNPRRAIERYAAKWGSLVPPDAGTGTGTVAQPELARATPAAIERAAEPAAAVAVAQPAVHHASARLEAVPSLPKPNRLTDEKIAEVQDLLAGMPLEQLRGLSNRDVGRMLGSENFRKRGGELRDAEIGHKTQSPESIPGNGRPPRQGVPQFVSPPVSHLPGGAAYG